MDKVPFDRAPVTRGVDKWFKIVNVSLVLVKVSVACGVAVLPLQLLGAHHGRADGSEPGAVELPQVNLEAKPRHRFKTVYSHCAHATKVPFKISYFPLKQS